jgi:thiamine-monophosphate kinase
MAKARTRPDQRGEFALIAALAKELASGSTRNVVCGIGDDAAVLRVGRERLVVTVDDQVEGVHFDRRWLGWEDVGYRAVQAAASDVAAMAGTPLCAVASLHVPPGFPSSALLRLARGQAEAARHLRCPVVGGNVSRSQVLSVTTTVLGRAARPLLRAGARPGDELWLIGEVGLARAGLLLHQERPKLPARLRLVAARARAAWARPEARIVAGRSLRGRARAAIDVSDGLAGDVNHLARASKVKAVVQAALLERLIGAELAELADCLGQAPVMLALVGGEDYALLAAGPAARRPRGARSVGRIERGAGAELELGDGRRFSLSQSFDHLRDSR